MWGAIAAVAASVIGSAMSSRSTKKAAEQSTGAQYAAIDEQQRQFDALQELLAPYAEAGETSLGQQMDLLGVNGAEAQQSAINAIQQGSAFQTALQQGETSILQNAAATGGLRGGNTQSALSEFSPQLLNQMVQQQYSNLGGITSLGQNAAAGVGNAGMQTGANIGNLLTGIGNTQASATAAQGQTWANTLGSVTGLLGGLGGIGGGTSSSSSLLNNAAMYGG